MSKGAFTFITVVLVVLWGALIFVFIPGGQTELAMHGELGYGTVQLKDSRPGPNGTMEHMLTVIYQDKGNKNHRVTIRMEDEGRYDSLKANQDIRVKYMPNDPDNASTEGGAGLMAPKSAALKFVAWTAFFAALVTGWSAYKASPREKKPKGPKITVIKNSR